MGLKFTLEGSTVSGSNIFTKISGQIRDLTDDAEIVIKGTHLTNSQLFSDLNITEFCSKVENQQDTPQMSKEEYASLQHVLKQRENKSAFSEALFRHLISFTEGVAASIVATCIRK